MRAAGIRSGSRLDELEDQLRTDFENEVGLGAHVEQAFKNAAEKIGDAFALAEEFGKLPQWNQPRLMKLAALASILFAIGVQCLVLPFVISLLAGAVVMNLLVWRYIPKWLPAIRSKSLRRNIALACFVGSFLWMRFFFADISANIPAHVLPLFPNFPSDTVFLVGMTFATMLGCVGYGLEKAAGMQTKKHA
jgi:hypothetical protein